MYPSTRYPHAHARLGPARSLHGFAEFIIDALPLPVNNRTYRPGTERAAAESGRTLVGTYIHTLVRIVMDVQSGSYKINDANGRITRMCHEVRETSP